jgi:hypothetical protein
MSNEPTVSKGIRLPQQVWRSIEEEAAALKMTPNEYLRRRLGALFFRAPDMQNQHLDMPTEPSVGAGVFDDR